MKITIRLFCILLAMLFCLTACSDSSLAQVDDDEQPKITLKADTFSAMHFSVNDADIYNKEVIIRQHPSEKFTDSDAEQEKVLMLGGKEISTNYVESFTDFKGGQANKYQSSDGIVSFTCSEATHEIYSIRASRDYFALPNNLKSEEDYLNWVKEVLKSYGVTDLSAYEYSCKTGLTEFGDDWAGGASKDYFYKDIDPTCETLSNYEFTYTRIIDGYVTADNISIYISIATDRLFIAFDKGQFANVAKIELDEERMLETLEQYVKECVNTEKYELLSYTVKNQTLTYVDQKLCMVCSVEMNLNPLTIPDIESFPVLDTIGVFCE
ncbi:MAG: hypothetical protein ACI3YH_02290 [Eubacteriales bacterium]